MTLYNDHENDGDTSIHCTVVSNCMKLTHSIHRHKSLSHEPRSERVSERANERSGARERSEQCGASE